MSVERALAIGCVAAAVTLALSQALAANSVFSSFLTWLSALGLAAVGVYFARGGTPAPEPITLTVAPTGPGLSECPGELLQALAVGLVVTTETGSIEWSNPALSSLIAGVEPGVNLFETLPAAGPALSRGEVIEVQAGERWLELAGVVFESRLGARRGAVVRDVTRRRLEVEGERRRAEDARVAQQSRSLALANTSHEIWTPVNGILGMARLLLCTELDETQRKYAEAVKTSGQKLTATLASIFDHSKVEAGVLDSPRAPFDLRDLVDSTVAARQAEARDHGLALSYRVEPLLPDSMIGAAVRLRQTLDYLLDNSLKFTEHGEINLAVSEESQRDGISQVRFSLSDTGPGIPEDKLDEVLLPFTQADGSHTRKHGGVGLGLTLAHELTRHMGGKLWLESRPGRGTTVHLRIPLEISTEPLEKNRDTASSRVSRQAVLLAGGDPALLAMLREMMGPWGLEPTTVDSAEAAREIQSSQRFDLLLVDADLEGAETLFPSPVGARVVMLAGSRLPQLSELASRGVQMLAKPVVPSELWNALIPPAEEEAGGLERKGVPPLRLLLVEDNVVNQNLASMMLEGYGHDVKVASHGAEAVQMFEIFEFDLILMDVQMPIMDGLEATRQIRALEKAAGGRRTPILALTAHGLKGDRERCLEAGMDGYLTKPINEPQLLLSMVAVLPAELLQERFDEEHRQSSKKSDRPGEAQGHSPASASPVAFDRDALMMRVGRSPANFRKIVDLFLSNSPTQLQQLRQFVVDGEPELAKNQAHTLKGTLLSLAAERAAAAALRLEERLLEEGPKQEWLEALGALEAEVAALVVDLRASADSLS